MKHSTDPDLPKWSAYLGRLKEQASQKLNRNLALPAKQDALETPGWKVAVKPDLNQLKAPVATPVEPAHNTAPHRERMSGGESAGNPPSCPLRVNPTARDVGSPHPIGDRRQEAARTPTARPVYKDFRQYLSSWLGYLAGLLGSVYQAVKPEPAWPVENNAPFYTKISLGLWGFYFVAKLGLFWMGLIGFHPLTNLFFAAFILLPVASLFWHRIKEAITAALAIALLYHDSWLPPVGRVIEKTSSWSNFSLVYLAELMARFISLPVVGLLLAAWLAYRFISYRVRMGALVVACMVVLWIVQSPLAGYVAQTFKGQEPGRVANQARPDMDQVLRAFFDREALRSVSFAAPRAETAPFDVIFIHVCSLSWDDVRAVGLEQHPLWRHFDILLKNFNSAASYSGPAVIHLLRANCGQQEHGKMYFAAPEKCYLMNSLQKSGFEPNLALNHNGKFDNFLQQVQTHGRLTTPPLSHEGLDIVQHSFYGAPLYDDLAVLNRWLKARQKSNSPRVALFYNTASLHDGNHLPDKEALPNTLESYKARLVKFLDSMEQFMNSLDASGRRTVVVMVPEHGGAVRGDKMQIAGLREIPTPAITLVPVGIKVIGGKAQRSGDTLSVEPPASYLAIAHILARMLEKSPFANDSFAPADYVAGLPSTPFVAQNEKITVAEYHHRYYLNNGSTGWEDYSEFNAPIAWP